MKLPTRLQPLRSTFLWQRASDWRYVRRNRPRCRFFRQFFRPGALVFDIGANVGHYTLLFHHLGARVLAVEPQAALVGQLKYRFRGFGRIQILQSAVGATAGAAELRKAPDLSEIASLREDVATRSRFAAEHTYSEREMVPVVTLDSLITQYGSPDFCKIDVEGFESQVLAGLSNAVPAISLEFNREFWDETKHCLEHLSRIGDYRYNFTLGEAAVLAAPEWRTSAALISDLGRITDPLLWGDIYARVNEIGSSKA